MIPGGATMDMAFLVGGVDGMVRLRLLITTLVGLPLLLPPRLHLLPLHLHLLPLRLRLPPKL